ncbi:hypothetical protein DITRI_Ditri01bG0125000 [Diplodiscus trichospermus]
MESQLCKEKFEDCISSGEYEVRSGYYVKKKEEIKARGDEASSSYNVDRKTWKEIWKSDVPSKLKVFMWRVVSNALATKESPWKRICYVVSGLREFGLSGNNKKLWNTCCYVVSGLREFGLQDVLVIEAESEYGNLTVNVGQEEREEEKGGRMGKTRKGVVCDGAFCQKTKEAGFGVIVRDEE